MSGAALRVSCSSSPEKKPRPPGPAVSLDPGCRRGASSGIVTRASGRLKRRPDARGRFEIEINGEARRSGEGSLGEGTVRSAAGRAGATRLLVAKRGEQLEGGRQ